MAEVTTILCPNCHKPNLRRAKFCQYCGKDIVLNNDPPSDERRYYITRVIKEGGQGAVYQAIDDKGKIYAAKEMLDRFSDPKERDEAIARFDAEANLLQKLNHPRIPRVYSHFEDLGRHYLTMDFVEGEDLDDILERTPGGLPEDQVLRWADQICDVLSYLHKNGLIYRDMKPSNVMIDKDDNVKLVDFGIAKLFKPTERGTQIGTPGYAPPEQYQGMATPASDIYALGATLHHMLTGRDPTEQPPFSFPPARNINPNISRRTSDVLETALKMKPEERYGSVAEMRALLRPLSSPSTHLPPVQVRVTPPTVMLPSQSPQPQAASAPSPAVPRSAPAPSVRSQPIQPAAPAQPVQASQPRVASVPAAVPTTPRKRGGFLRFVGNLIVTLLVLAAISVGVIWFVYPDLLGGILPSIEQVIPGAQPTAVPTTVQLVPRFYQADVEVTVPSGTSDSDIRLKLQEAYQQKAQAELGAATRINQNVPPSPIGGIEKVSEANGNATYQANMSGQVLAP